MRAIWIILVLGCATCSAQSIVMSGSGGSIVASGQNESVPEVVTVVKPVVVVTAKPSVPAVTKTRQFYLVSESWCQHCPAAKRRFLAKGWPERNVMTIAECKRRFGFTVPSVPYEFGEPVAPSVSIAVKSIRPAARLPVVQTQWGTIDLQTYQKNCNCPMCQGIRALQQQYQQSLYSLPTESLPPPQQPTPSAVIDEMLPLLQLNPSSVLADFGCGDGRILIAAVERYGCNAVGIEIDPVIADTARRRVLASGLSDRIRIVTGDVLEYDPATDHVTHAVAYLFPELLGKLAATLATIPVVASPFHEVPGIGQRQIGDVWIR